MSALTTHAKNLVATLGLSGVGTLGLLALHHQWRKQHYPNAHWQDYHQGLFKKIHQMASVAHAKNSPLWVSGVANLDETFAVVAINQHFQIQWHTHLPERVHDVVAQPHRQSTARHIVVMGRRPSENFWVLNAKTGQILYHLMAKKHRHFYGHACFGQDGRYLYVSENDTATFDGKIGVYDSQHHYQKVNEFDSFAIGTHELRLHPDGDKLVLANGGIKTEKASRDELNLDVMQPSLAYVDCQTGELLQQVMPSHHQMSVRHLAVMPSGLVLIGVQFQGQKQHNVPLLLSHRFGDKLLCPLSMPNHHWQGFHQYIASIAVNPTLNLACATSPIGGCAVLVDLTTRQWVQTFALPDCAGVAMAKDGFVISDGQGKLHHIYQHKTGEFVKQSFGFGVSFDNHLQAII